ncbi:MAG: hypothetical protein AAGU16_09335 [Desulfitobacterium hafniense]|uniref:hypothetical protein n=1 Tax=Desulfitobacterium hafniense TaxID=49338 RepID=UPI0012F976EA|nr:hypothetical protein [Desulfitobacterium hafniense]
MLCTVFHNDCFWSLAAIGVIDGATRMAFLTFLPFLLQEKGAGVNMIGFTPAFIFAGDATGKLVCGILVTLPLTLPLRGRFQ